MKFIYLFLLFFKITFAAVCSMSVPSLNYGNYNYSSGNNQFLNMPTVCPGISRAHIDYSGGGPTNNPNDYSVVLKNGSNSVVANLQYWYWSVYNVVVFNPCYPDPTYGQPWASANGSICANTSISSGQALVPGVYTASVPIVYVGYYQGTAYNGNYTLNLSLTVPISCSISSSGINFGSITGLSDTNTTAIINSNCTNTTPYTISADGGNSSNINNRIMKSGSNSLGYQLYVDSSYTSVFGDGINGNKISSIGTGNNQQTVIYGKIPSGQYPTPGSYSDSLIITLTY